MKFPIPASILALLLLSGCRHTPGRELPDRGLSPTTDAGVVNVTIKVPTELDTMEMRVMYRSKTCIFTDHTASGIPYDRDGYQRMDLKPIQQEQSRLYEAKVPVDGGGSCNWTLSNITFGAEYRDTSAFGEGIESGRPAGMIVIFDDNSSPHGSWDFKVDGDLTVVRDYYPWFNESFLGGHGKSISLTTNGHFYLMYKAPHARSIYFEPVLHSNFLTRSVGPKVKQSGNRTIFYYPDGSSSFETYTKPNHAKLQAIRMAAEAQH
ncbi:hypothetical protein DBR33_15455 [Stenotrophomonas sp. HMWF022]|uniref:hypothetical protein n=1 Tax=Stenotrophomonas sp. HMWF023 TaxID=2056859 RepID=UPI000D348C4A|nr:hypothetical protein [Stenotrophomonas sp. HMWF023]PTS72808.1 hypothetical protein DBR20_17125 [Stenotrophomonas sp. HMWF023]PTT39707.1 hypothetical protein DBR33_15455 [Stenotrophomonas sp. HMWF022]